MNAWTETVPASLAAWLLDFSLLASVVLAAAIGLRWCFRHPAQRVALAWGTWLGLLALAVVAALPLWPRISLRLPPKQSAMTVIVSEPVVTLLPTDVVPGTPALLAEILPETVAPPQTNTAPQAATTWRNWLALSWLAAAGLAVSWIAFGLWQTWRLVRRSAVAPQWIVGELQSIVGCQRRSPPVRTSPRLTSAAAVGAIVPRILLPATVADQSNRPIVRAALAHEWAHIRRGDLWLLALERLLLPLLAWQPLFWWLRRSVRLDLELLADAAAAGDEPIEYAEALLAWAKTAERPAAGLAALSLWESPHTLSRRVTMLLDPKRPRTTRTNRGWQLLLIAAALLLAAGSSLLTLRPRTADGQEAQPPAAEATVTGAAEKPVTAIYLNCLVLEAERIDLAEELTLVGRPQASPDADITLKAPQDWQARLKRLTARPGTTILSRPQIKTLDGQTAEVQIGQSPPLAPAGENSDAGLATNLKPLGLHVRLTPHLPRESGEGIVLLLSGQHSQLEPKDGGPADVVERKLSAKAVVPSGETLIVVSRPKMAERRALVLAIGVHAQTEQDPPQLARSEDLQKVVRQLERQLAERTAEAQKQRDQSEALRKQVEDLKWQLDKLTAGQVSNTIKVFKLQHAQAADVAAALRTLFAQAVTLGSDPLIENIKLASDPATNSLIVSGPTKFQQTTSAIIAKLDGPTAGQSSPRTGGGAAAADPATADQRRWQDPNIQDWLRKQQGDSDSQASTAARAAQAAEIDTQVQLLKLDLQEAEIGLAAAQKDLQRVQELQKQNAISSSEVAKFEFQTQAAQIKVMRVKIMLEGAMRQLIVTPAAKDPQIVPTQPAPRR